MLHGSLHPDFAPVGVSLSRILPRRGPGGASVCVYHRGVKVVDIWGGTRDAAGSPWQEDTLSLSYSTSKGVASTLMHMCVDRGLLDYDDAVRNKAGVAGKERSGRERYGHATLTRLEGDPGGITGAWIHPIHRPARLANRRRVAERERLVLVLSILDRFE